MKRKKVYICEECTLFFQFSDKFQIYDIKNFEKNVICHHCSKEILLEYKKKMRRALEELRMYESTLNQLHNIEKETIKMKIEMDSVIEKEKLLKKKKNSMYIKINKKSYQNKMLENLLNRYWKFFHLYSCLKINFNEEKKSLINKMFIVAKDLNYLNSRSVLNECFHIWYNKEILTINNFRIGRRHNDQIIDWNEINFGLGECVMLLRVLSKLKNYTFKSFQIFPRGSRSCLKFLNDSSMFELFYSNHNENEKNNQFFLNKFNRALMGLISCIKEIGGKVIVFLWLILGVLNVKLPFVVGDSSVGDLSVKYSKKYEKNWTIACKYILLNLKFLIKEMCIHNKI